MRSTNSENIEAINPASPKLAMEGHVQILPEVAEKNKEAHGFEMSLPIGWAIMSTHGFSIAAMSLSVTFFLC